jgi:hypothetical protein
MEIVQEQADSFLRKSDSAAGVPLAIAALIGIAI